MTILLDARTATDHFPGIGRYVVNLTGALPIPLDQGLVGWVTRERKPVRAGNVLADRRYVPITLSTRSQMAAPLVAGDRTIGVINVESPQLDAFSSDDLLLLTTLAEKLSLLFEKSRLEGRLAAHVVTLQQQVRDYVGQLEAANMELQQAKRETEQADQMRKQFLARLNQALRTPHKTIAGLAEALEGDDLALVAVATPPAVSEQSSASRH